MFLLALHRGHFCSCPQVCRLPRRSAATAFTTVDCASMPLQIVYDAKEWWDTTRRLWLYSVLSREQMGLPPRRLAEYAAERALLLHQELPPDASGVTARRPASRSSTAATTTVTSSAIVPVCKTSKVKRKDKKNTRNKKTDKKEKKLDGHKVETSCEMLWT